MPGLNHHGKTFTTTTEWTPYADKRAQRNCTASTSKDGTKPHNFNILVIVLDSVSRLRWGQLFARTDALLKSNFTERMSGSGEIRKHNNDANASVYDFKWTSVFAQNTNGNVRRMFDNCGKDCENLANVFSHANSHGFIPSVIDDCESVSPPL